MPPISGLGGAVYVGSPLVKVADTTSWTIDITEQIHRTSVKGNAWERKQAGRADGTLTIDRYVATTAVLTALIPAQVVAGNVPVTFRLDAIDANGSFQQVSGTGYITRGTIAMPHDDAARDSVEISLDGVPTFSP